MQYGLIKKKTRYDPSADRRRNPVPGELLLYTSPDGNIRLDLRIHDETLWMTQQMMAELFQTSVQNIIMHVKNIYEDAELEGKELVRISYKFVRRVCVRLDVPSLFTTSI